jgi:hypothetical protein
MRSMVEGYRRVIPTAKGCIGACQLSSDHSRVPLHHPLRGWSPSPEGEDYRQLCSHIQN